MKNNDDGWKNPLGQTREDFTLGIVPDESKAVKVPMSCGGWFLLFLIGGFLIFLSWIILANP